MADRLPTVKEVTELLSTSKRTVYRLLAEGKLRSLVISRGSRRIPESEIERCISKRRPDQQASRCHSSFSHRPGTLTREVEPERRAELGLRATLRADKPHLEQGRAEGGAEHEPTTKPRQVAPADECGEGVTGIGKRSTFDPAAYGLAALQGEECPETECGVAEREAPSNRLHTRCGGVLADPKAPRRARGEHAEGAEHDPRRSQGPDELPIVHLHPPTRRAAECPTRRWLFA